MTGRQAHRSGVVKRCVDLVAATILLVSFAPVLVVLALFVRWRLGSPVLFRQVRPGLRGRPFTMFKFRSMRDAVGPDGATLPDISRLDSFGRKLRASSLDELPELFNVLLGDMSLVGPRPLLMEYLPLYSPEQSRRHEVRPGITGWAQVNGRNAVPWPDRLAMDVWYVDHRSFWLDLRILVMTIGRVVERRGISASGEATMTHFTGER
jgi:lipopolysaccharide/colanic/teichoic acid biosynthesis glycosyltransferase